MHPRQSKKSNFRAHYLVGGEIRSVGAVTLAVLVCALRAATKKGSQLFEEKSAPQRKCWIRLCPVDHRPRTCPNPGLS